MNTIENKNHVNNQLKAKLKEATRKTTPMSFDERIQKIKGIRPSKPIFCSMISAANLAGKKDHGTQKRFIPGNA